MSVSTCGTSDWVLIVKLAPEVLKEKGYDGKMADVWSCGVILYVMLAGYLPFEDETMKGLFAKIELGKFTYPPHFTKEQIELISKMLVVDPSKRITVDQIMDHKWFKVNFKIDRTTSKISLTDKEIDASVKTTGDVTEVQSSSSATQVKPGTLNAFDLASMLMMGSMNPLMSSDASVKIRRETRFMAKGKKEEAKQAIINKLDQLKAKPTTKGDDEIKCMATVNQSVITFSIKIEETSGGFSVVEVRRGKGNILDYNAFYRLLCTQLGSLVVSKEIHK